MCAIIGASQQNADGANHANHLPDPYTEPSARLLATQTRFAPGVPFFAPSLSASQLAPLTRQNALSPILSPARMVSQTGPQVGAYPGGTRANPQSPGGTRANTQSPARHIDIRKQSVGLGVHQGAQALQRGRTFPEQGARQKHPGQVQPAMGDSNDQQVECALDAATAPLDEDSSFIDNSTSPNSSFPLPNPPEPVQMPNATSRCSNTTCQASKQVVDLARASHAQSPNIRIHQPPRADVSRQEMGRTQSPSPAQSPTGQAGLRARQSEGRGSNSNSQSTDESGSGSTFNEGSPTDRPSGMPLAAISFHLSFH